VTCDPITAGVNVAFGHDCVMDPWHGVCCDYMLEVAHMGLHVAQMTSQKDTRKEAPKEHMKLLPAKPEKEEESNTIRFDIKTHIF